MKINHIEQMKTSLNSLSVEELIECIEDSHHIDERELLKTLDQLVNKILIVHYEHHSKELIKVHRLFSDLRKELIEHFVIEEQTIFPMMKGRSESEHQLLTLIEDTKEQHKTVTSILNQLQAATNDFTPPKGVCQTFVLTYQMLEKLVRDVISHIDTESSVLFVKFEM